MVEHGINYMNMQKQNKSYSQSQNIKKTKQQVDRADSMGSKSIKTATVPKTQNLNWKVMMGQEGKPIKQNS